MSHQIIFTVKSSGDVSIANDSTSYPVKRSGYEDGMASRLSAPTYSILDAQDEPLADVSGHMFGNQPFYVVKAASTHKTVKLSQEMSELAIGYQISGGGFSLEGSFPRGAFSIARHGAEAASVRATIEDGTIKVEMDVLDAALMPWLVGLGTAAGLMVRKLNLPPS